MEPPSVVNIGTVLNDKSDQHEPKENLSMKHPLFFLIPILAIQCARLDASDSNSAPPNLLLIIADDCTHRDLEVYGGQAKTPHLARLASQGIKFTHCFQAAPMCSPTRHCLYTGLYPVKSGAYPNHTMAHGWVKSIAHYLQDAGYTTHLSGKTHINPKSVFRFQYSGNIRSVGGSRRFSTTAPTTIDAVWLSGLMPKHRRWLAY